MILLDMLWWWYTTGWSGVLQRVQRRTSGILAAFSVGLLASTLFAPFRQIDAGGVRGPIDVQMRAWFDRTFSRFVGFGVRLVMILSGCLTALAVLVGGMLWAAVWLVLPVMPIAGLILTLTGWSF